MLSREYSKDAIPEVASLAEAVRFRALLNQSAALGVLSTITLMLGAKLSSCQFFEPLPVPCSEVAV